MTKTASKSKKPAARKKVWILMGGNDTGKSTIVRCLTGVGRADNGSVGAKRKIAFSNGSDQKFFIFIQSFQEGKKLYKKSAKHWANFIVGHKCNNFLISLHDDSEIRSGEDYIEAFMKTGAVNIEWLIQLETPQAENFSDWVKGYPIANRKIVKCFKSKNKQPSTRSAGDIRKLFGWY